MLTLRQSAELLRAGHSADGRLALARMLGFEDAPLSVDPDAARRLGLPASVRDVHVVRGRGAMRALAFSTSATAIRAELAQVAASLQSTTSHVLWFLIAASDEGDVALACWSGTLRGPRVAALAAVASRIVASDAEVLVALEAALDGNDLLVHTRWTEILGRDALSRRFYRVLEQRVHGLAESLSVRSADDRHELALLCASRLLFLSFLEAKGWLDNDPRFLSRRFDDCMASGGGFHRRVLLPLFFGTLNTPIALRSAVARRFGAIPFLNGGLFAKSALEKRHSAARFSDEAFGALFGDVFDAFRFSAREGQDAWSEASVDPEMLGRAFECLMASRERRTTGAFYTPQEIVSHLTDRALIAALAVGDLSANVVRASLHGDGIGSNDAALLRARLRHFTVLDPACGSGAFLVHVLEKVAALHRVAGDDRHLSAIRREVLARSIHGVDVNPMAVWLCELRLWLSVVIESDETRMSAVPPLPNLDCSVREGDSLAGDAFNEPPSLVGTPLVLARLRDRYIRATGPRKAPLRRALARDELRRAIAAIDRELVAVGGRRRERLLARRSADLFGDRTPVTADQRVEMRAERLRAAALRRERRRLADGGSLSFSFPSHFGSVHARSGFDLVIGNPPWVRLHNIPLAARGSLRARYRVYRNAAWESGSRGGHASRGFASQVDLAALFVERSAGLASPTGVIALLLPAKLWRSLAGGGVRAMLTDELALMEVADWSDASSSFDAAVYPSLIIATRRHEGDGVLLSGVRQRTLAMEWEQPRSALRLHPQDSASPWLILPPDVRSAFERIAGHGRPLGQSGFGRAMLGVKCGCNDAFTIEVGEVSNERVAIRHRGRTGEVERSVVRPLLRGDAVAAWRIPLSKSGILWTHEGSGPALRALPSGAAKWLGPWKRQLSGRTDLHGSTKWWSLFRTEGADPTHSRVVWSDFGRVPRAAFLPAGDPSVPLNSCYVVACENERDALALTALMNSALAAAWLNAIAEPARGGWRRYLAWTVSLLPVPRDWSHACALLAPMTERAIVGDVPTTEELLDVACRAYRIRRTDIAPLLAWSHCATQR